MICNECETVAHCTKHGCVPKQPAPVQEGWKLVPVVATREIEDAIGKARNLKASEIWEDALAATPPAAQPAPVQEPVQSGLDADCIASIVSQRYTTPPAAPVQECLVHGECFGGKCIYTTPPAQPAQRQWVGLTEDDVIWLCKTAKSHEQTWGMFVRTIEAKLKEKNNG
jgi:hypothetical protein